VKCLFSFFILRTLSASERSVKQNLNDTGLQYFKKLSINYLEINFLVTNIVLKKRTKLEIIDSDFDKEETDLIECVNTECCKL